jgi:hypothetical protein
MVSSHRRLLGTLIGLFPTASALAAVDVAGHPATA